MFLRAVVFFMLAMVVLSAAEPKKAKKGSQPKAPAAESQTFSGCLDQRGDSYFLAGSQMKETAQLRGKAFSDDNFARYIGHQVTVYGSVDRASGSPIVQVVRITDVSESCR